MSDKELDQTEVEIENNAEVVEEETSNAATIATHPTVSRSELLRTMVSYATKLGPEELANFVSRIGNAEEITKTPDEVYASTQQTTGDASGKNKASIKSSGAPADAMHSVKEDLALLFGNDETLSEDFKTRTEALFEAAVATRVELEVAKIEENLAEEAEKTVAQIKEEMEANVDTFLNYAVAEWMTENKLAVESSVKTEIAESFLNGLKDLFEEHYVSIPDEQVDVVESLAAKVAELETQISEANKANEDLQKVVAEKHVAEETNKLSEGLTDTQKEKFAKLIEAINYSSADEFSKKASIIKETYFNSKSEVKVVQDQLLSEEVEEPAAAEVIAPDMQMYVSSLSKSLKK